MECRNREVVRGVAEYTQKPLAQRRRGGRGEGDREYRGSRHSALLHEVRDAPRKHGCLAASRAGKDAEWAVASFDDFALVRGEVADVQMGAG